MYRPVTYQPEPLQRHLALRYIHVIPFSPVPRSRYLSFWEAAWSLITCLSPKFKSSKLELSPPLQRAVPLCISHLLRKHE